MTRRCNNWPAKLALFIEEKRGQPFDWAVNNCCFFACDWLAMLTGVDPASDFRDEVDSALSAQRVLNARGGLDEMAIAAFDRWGWLEVVPALARRGDVVEVQTELGPALGVCCGLRSVFPGMAGIEWRETLLVLRAWRVG